MAYSFGSAEMTQRYGLRAATTMQGLKQSGSRFEQQRDALAATDA